MLVPYNPSMNVVGDKWVYKVKLNVDCTLKKLKAKLVVKGFQQTPVINHLETLNLLVKPITIIVIISLAITKHWPINNAF